MRLWMTEFDLSAKLKTNYFLQLCYRQIFSTTLLFCLFSVNCLAWPDKTFLSCSVNKQIPNSTQHILSGSHSPKIFEMDTLSVTSWMSSILSFLQNWKQILHITINLQTDIQHQIIFVFFQLHVFCSSIDKNIPNSTHFYECVQELNSNCLHYLTRFHV